MRFLRELQVGQRHVHLLAADQLRDEVELLRGNPQVPHHRSRLGLAQHPLPLCLAHVTSPSICLPALPQAVDAAGFALTAFLSPLCEWNVRVGENSPNLWPIMSSVTFTGTNFCPL